jgi:hypothetical protein
MTNEEKAREIASAVHYDPAKQIQFLNDRAYKAALQMAQWKDEQYAELMVKVVEKNEEIKRLTRQISDNLNQMLKINNNSTN